MLHYAVANVLCLVFAASTVLIEKNARGTVFAALMFGYWQSKHGFNIFPQMSLTHGHMHTSEDIQVILESWMNSEK